MLNSVRTRAASSVLNGTNAAVPRPIWAVETSANKNVALNVLSANFSVRSRRNQATNRGENSLVPNWTSSKTTEVTKPVNAIMPLPSADSADVTLDALNDLVSTIGSAWSQRTRPTLRPSATSTYTAGTNQRLSHTRLATRRKRMRLVMPAIVRIAWW
jgi:hypothetical protein